MKDIYTIIEDPEIFELNRLQPHSAHINIYSLSESGKALILNGKWDFNYYPNPRELLSENPNPETIIPSGEITVPSNIQLQGFGSPGYTNTMYSWDGIEDIKPPKIPSLNNPTALYLKHFILNDEMKEKRLRLCIDGAESCIFVWLNEKFIGYSENSFSPAEFDITTQACPGENKLTILNVKHCSGSWLEDQDFWGLSGIFRDVYIYAVEDQFIEDIELTAALAEDFTSGRLKLSCLIDSLTPAGCELLLLIDGKPKIRSGKLNLAKGPSWHELSTEIASPLLGSAEAPNLYDVELQLLINDSIKDNASLKTGFRRFEIENGVMKLNGKRIIFKGVNRNEFHTERGRAITDTDIEEDLQIIKRNNLNAVRTSHYPNRQRFYDLCDRYGLYVIDEVNLETHGTWMVMGAPRPNEHTLPGDKPVWKGAVMDRAEAMIERDKNHPSILIWSCGNESYNGTIIRDMALWIRERDPSRLLQYEGVFFERRFDKEVSDVESRMYSKPSEITQYLDGEDTKPFILCEYAHAMGNSFGNIDEYIGLEKKYERYQGGFIWDYMDMALTGTDHSGVRRLMVGGEFDDRPNDGNFCGDGLLFADKKELAKMQHAKALFSPIGFSFSGGDAVIKNNNLFIDTSEYVFEWSILDDGSSVKSGKLKCIIAAGESKKLPLSQFAVPANCGEGVLELRVLQGKGTPWAPAGFEIAFGQHILKRKSFTPPAGKPAALVAGDCNLGADLSSGFALISRQNGALYSIKNRGVEMLLYGLLPDLWRAPTDNDLANNNTTRWFSWKTASLYPTLRDFRINRDCSSATSYYILPNGAELSISYSFLELGIIEIEEKLQPIEEDLPLFGISIFLPPAFSVFESYGNIQDESYPDRSRPRLGIMRSTPADRYSPYLNPQECGNQDEIRRLRLTDTRGLGLEITSDAPFSASVLPYTSHEMEAAHNISELPPVKKTVLSLRGGVCGIGGDDSWGAPVHDEYLLDASEGLDVKFYLKLI